jgi:hypothetical protein
MAFRPSPRMSLHQICASTVAYIFMHDAEQQRRYAFLIRMLNLNVDLSIKIYLITPNSAYIDCL